MAIKWYKYSEEQDDFIRKFGPVMNNDLIAKKLGGGLKYYNIASRRYKLGVKKAKPLAIYDPVKIYHQNRINRLHATKVEMMNKDIRFNISNFKESLSESVLRAIKFYKKIL